MHGISNLHTTCTKTHSATEEGKKDDSTAPYVHLRPRIQPGVHAKGKVTQVNSNNNKNNNNNKIINNNNNNNSNNNIIIFLNINISVIVTIIISIVSIFIIIKYNLLNNF